MEKTGARSILVLSTVAALLLPPGLARGQTPAPTPTPAPQTTVSATPEPQPSPSQSPGAGAELALTFKGPTTAPLVGEGFGYSLAVTNNGPETATEVQADVYLPEGVELQSSTSSDPNDACAVQESPPPYAEPQPRDGGTQPRTHPIRAGGSLSCSLGSMGAGETTTISIEVRRTSAQEIYSSASVYASTSDPDYNNNYGEVVVPADTSNPSDVWVVKTAPRSPEAGADFNYVLTVSNDGPSAANAVALTDFLPTEVDFRSVTSGDPSDECTLVGSGPDQGGGSYGYAEVRCHMGTLASGETTKVTIAVTRTRAYEIYNSASVALSNYDTNYENNYASVAIPADESNPADLGITKDGPRDPDMGAEFRYTLTVTNAGPARARTVAVVDSLPEGVEFRGATVTSGGGSCVLYEAPAYQEPQPAPDGSPVYYNYREVRCSLGDVAVGGSATIVITVARTSPWEIWNYAWVGGASFDPNYANDYAYAQTTADESVTSDLAVAASGPGSTPVVGSDFVYVVAVINNGPAATEDVWLTDYLPEGVDFVSAVPVDASDSCTYEEYSGDPVVLEGSPPPSQGGAPTEDGRAESSVYPGYSSRFLNCSLGALAAGETDSVGITVTRTNAQELWNSASAYSRNYEPNYDNNYAEVVTEPDRSNPADVGVTMAAPRRPEVGEEFTYRLTATNAGPSTARQVVVSDYLPYGVDYSSATSSDPADTCALYEGYPVATGEPAPEGGSGGTTEPYPSEDGSVRPYYGFREVRCLLGALAPGETADVSIAVVRTSPYELWNSATAASAPDYDDNPGNDYAQVLIEGEPYPGACPYGGGGASGSEGPEVIVVDDCSVAAGGGADTVSVEAGSKTGDVRVAAGPGADSIYVNLRAGTNDQRRIEIHGGRGGDTVTVTAAPGAGSRTVVIYAERGLDSINLDIPAGIADLRIVVVGGPGDDTVRSFVTAGPNSGTSSAVRLVGGPGNDVLLGGAGPDTLRGGEGRDNLDGRTGDDRLDGGRGRDICRGGPGRDALDAC